MKESVVDIFMTRESGNHNVSIAIIKGNLEVLSNQLSKLHPKEKIRYDALKYARRKESYLLSRLSAKSAITGLLKVNTPEKIWIDSGVFDFPVVRYAMFPNTCVSITHCEGIGMSTAYDEMHPMGIDLEKISSDKEETILSQITDYEKGLLNKVGMATIFGYTILWCAKEALSKVLKTGMMIDFKLLAIESITSTHKTVECTFSNFPQYKALSHTNDEYAISIVLPRKTEADFTEVWQQFDSID